MLRYYFHVRNGEGFVEDEEGKELSNLAEARAVAVDAIRSIISDESREGKVDLRGRVEVVDDSQILVLIVPFSEAIEVHTGALPGRGVEPGFHV